MDPQIATPYDCPNPPDMPLFDLLVRDARKLRPGKLAREIDYVIDTGRVNADDTYPTVRFGRDAEWHEIAIESICCTLSERTYPSKKRVLAWFARRGVKP